MNKRFTYRFDWGNESYSSWETLADGVEAIRKDPARFMASPTPEAVAKLIERLDKMDVGGFADCYHDSSYKMLDGIKQSCAEHVEFKRVA